jgi:galactosamine-6-phosphate isomerase
MKIEHYKNHEGISQRAVDLILAELLRKKDLMLCAATGNSPTRTYELLRQANEKKPGLFASLRIIKLDEWGGIPSDFPGTCETYLRDQLIRPMNISPERYVAFSSDPAEPEAECRRIQSALNQSGGIDICILGLGMNGHIALNEPAGYLKPFCHVAELSTTTLQHPMAAGMGNKPSFGLTLGMTEILSSKKIIMLIHGKNKRTIAQELFTGKISTWLPASFLWLHPDTVCLSDV